jgi:hypothetical protein
MSDSDFLDALIARLLSLTVPTAAELATAAVFDFVQVMSERAGSALWLMITGIDGDTIACTVATECEPYQFGEAISCQRQHVHAITPLASLPAELQERIRTNTLTAGRRKRLKQLALAHALDRAAWESRVQRWHMDTFNEKLSPFDLEGTASAYQRKGDISRQQAVRGWLYARALRSLPSPHSPQSRSDR